MGPVNQKQRLACLAVLVLCADWLRGGTGVQLHLIEGEGAIYSVGGRATRGVSVEVTDDAGRPVAGALVNFRLPDDGPGGVFGSGRRVEAVTTAADGRAGVWGMRWNNTSGPFEIRITAVKDQARAGIVANQQLTDAVQAKSGGTGTFQPSHHFFNKWVVIGLVGAGAAGGVLAFTHLHSSSTTASSPAAIPTSIGTPVVIIGHP